MTNYVYKEQSAYMSGNNNNQAVYYFHQGTNYESYRYYGAHPFEKDGESGAVFRVWAPAARAVAVAGDFNGWQRAPLERITDQGDWEGFVPGARDYDCYKYFITAADGRTLEKADPFAFHCQTPPSNASKFFDLSGYEWHDGEWQHRQVGDLFNSPMNIYEVHLGSWRRHADGNFFTYRELAEELPQYAREMGYTHLELMPVSEYPFDGSWGYQVTGYYAPTSRYGTPKDFMYFVDRCHQERIGVILDWVPAHFPKDSHGLMEFDGSCCYEDANPMRREHKEWGTRIFDFGKPEVQSFLISSAFQWLDVYHADGLRVDAVASMLYLDYGRRDGEWQPNSQGGRENLEAVAFLRKLNEQLLTRFPRAIMAAEESTAWPMVTKPASDGGLGFNFKWNMGWMNDSLSYCSTDPYFRAGCHNKLTFSMMYAFSENFILPISHDEVVHGKRSMIGRMPGDYEQQFANLRAFYAYMYAHPGKKLSFMGNEIAQFIEWRYYEELEWKLLSFDKHRRFHDFMKKLGNLYKDRKEFWEDDCSWEGFRWINPNDGGRNCLSFIRTAKDGRRIAVICNFSASAWHDYVIGVPEKGEYKVLLDSSDPEWGGSGTPRASYHSQDEPWLDFPHSLKLDMAPMTALYLEIPKKAKRR